MKIIQNYLQIYVKKFNIAIKTFTVFLITDLL
jgi:hypothetical protein